MNTGEQNLSNHGGHRQARDADNRPNGDAGESAANSRRQGAWRDKPESQGLSSRFPHTMDNMPDLVLCRRAGRIVGWGAMFWVAVMVLWWLLQDHVSIKFLLILLIFCGISIQEASRFACYVGLAILAWCFTADVLAGMVHLHGNGPAIVARSLPKAPLWLLWTQIVVYGLWVLVSVVMVGCALQATKRLESRQ